MSDTNWLATLGSWLVLPLKAILRPWWNQLVEEKAESVAVRSKLLEAIVRFRLHDCEGPRGLDSHRAGGIAALIIDRLKPIAKDLSVDLIGEQFLRTVEIEIELHSVTASAWVQLGCLATLQRFNPNQALVIEFRDDSGSQSHASGVIASLQSSFPFTRIMCFTSDPNVPSPAGTIQMTAWLSNDAESILKEYCSRNVFPSTQFELQDFVQMMGWPFQFANVPQTLPRSWKPSLQPEPAPTPA